MVNKSVIVVSLDKDILELLSHIPEIQVLGFTDLDKNARDSVYPNLGTEQEWEFLQVKYPESRIVLAVDVPAVRMKLAAFYGEERLYSLIAPNAHISSTSIIGHGTIIQYGVYISRDVVIGKVCKINVNATIHHDVSIDDYTTIAPGASLLGSVKVGKQCYIGAGAIILPNLRIGDCVTIGAGAVVTADISDGEVVVGVPARSRN